MSPPPVMISSGFMERLGASPSGLLMLIGGMAWFEARSGMIAGARSTQMIALGHDSVVFV